MRSQTVGSWESGHESLPVTLSFATLHAYTCLSCFNSPCLEHCMQWLASTAGVLLPSMSMRQSVYCHSDQIPTYCTHMGGFVSVCVKRCVQGGWKALLVTQSSLPHQGLVVETINNVPQCVSEKRENSKRVGEGAFASWPEGAEGH